MHAYYTSLVARGGTEHASRVMVCLNLFCLGQVTSMPLLLMNCMMPPILVTRASLNV